MTCLVVERVQVGRLLESKSWEIKLMGLVQAGQDTGQIGIAMER